MMAGYNHFNRQYRLAAGPAGGTGFVIGEVVDGGMPLNVEFSFEKSDLTSQNTGKISIWNLNKQHMAELEKKDCAVSFRAGYGNNMHLIFAGLVSFCSTDVDGADRKTEIEVVDNLISIRDTHVSLSYRGVISWEKIFIDVAAILGVAVIFSHNVSFAQLSNGFAYVGLAKNVLDKGCACCGLSWSIQNGVLQIKKPGDVISDYVYSLDKDSGLIGTPVRVTFSSKGEASTKLTGWDVELFLNGALNVDDYVKLESNTVSGYFRVFSLQYSGSTTGDWICKARLIEA